MTRTELDPDRVLAELTVEEKASLVLGSDFWHTAEVARLGVPRLMLADGPHGLRMQPEGGDHAGLGGSAPATCFPTASALASSWDPGLLADVGHALGEEALAQGVSVVLGPGVNIKRSPLCGRNFEYFSEDPFLAGELAVAMVAALQEHGVGTSVKHFAANNQETDRLRVSAEVDERTLREIYLPAFERVVSGAAPWTVMCAYNKVNGVYASEHRWLLTDVLRGEWGFGGLVVSDWGAVHDRVAALRAGLDLEMPPALGRSDREVVEAVRSGTLDEAVLDQAARHVLELVVRAQPALSAEAPPLEETAHHALARRAASSSAVLLKNDGILPLAPSSGQRIAVLGAFATRPRFQGAGSSQVNPTRVDVPLDELRTALPDGVDVTYAAGFDLADADADPDWALVSEAVSAARDADVAVLFLGLPDDAESEGFDRRHVDLPAAQLALVDAVSEVQDRVAVVLANGAAVRLHPWQDRVAAVLECWLGGQAAGGAVADLLTGVVNPSGKLAETLPLRLQDSPSYLNFPGDPQVVRYGEGVFVGYRGHDALAHQVSHPFGFGLSYTTFEVGAPTVDVSGSVADGDLRVDVTVPVTNTGDRAGAEVVQLYVADVESSVSRPPKELKAFAKVLLDPGATAVVPLRLDARSFSFWSTVAGRWVVEAGEFALLVGTSSRHLPHRHVLHLEAPSFAPPVHRDSTLHEWLADTDAAAVLLAVMDEARQAGGNVPDDREVAIIGSMPMSTLATFGIAGLTHDRLDELVARLRSGPRG